MRRVKRTDVRIDLTAQEFSLLPLLTERQGEVLTRTFITSQIWDMNFEATQTMSMPPSHEPWNARDDAADRMSAVWTRGEPRVGCGMYRLLEITIVEEESR
ncbi:hypothetical protein OKW41_009195 [Paraburkholderia sp. UCT70]